MDELDGWMGGRKDENAGAGWTRQRGASCTKRWSEGPPGEHGGGGGEWRDVVGVT